MKLEPLDLDLGLYADDEDDIVCLYSLYHCDCKVARVAYMHVKTGVKSVNTHLSVFKKKFPVRLTDFEVQR